MRSRRPATHQLTTEAAAHGALATHLGLSPTAVALLADSLRDGRRPLRRIAALSVAESAPALASGWVTAVALNDGFLRGRPGIGLAWLGVLAVLYVVRAVAERAVLTSLAAVIEPMRDRLTHHVVHNTLLQATTSDQSPDTAGVSRLSSQIDSVRDLTGALLRTARPLAVTLIAASAGLAALDRLLALLVIVPLGAAVAVFGWSMRRLTGLRRATVLAAEEVAGQSGEALTCARDITSLGAEEQAAALVAERVDTARRSLVRVGRASALRTPVVLVGGYVPLLGLLLVGGHLTDVHAVTTGALIGAVTYVSGSVIPALQLMTGTVSGYWSQFGVLLNRLAEAAPVPTPDTLPGAPTPRSTPRSAPRSAPRPTQTSGPCITPDISVESLTFAYGPGAEPVLRDLDLTIPHGDHLAIVGASGIGKSTLAQLLAGTRAPTSGAVRVAGRRIIDLPEELRPGLVALVPQEAYVFPGTVRDNLGYLAPQLTDPELLGAAEALGMLPLLVRLGGLDAWLPDPVGTLSSGERQLIALGRTYLSPASVVVLDEATSHLDRAAEGRAEAAFQQRHGTLVVIAHRSSSAARARRVLHLDGDRATLT